jgi:hypothetical protein
MLSWVDNATAALNGQKRDAIEVVASQRPPVIDADGIQAATAPFLAVFVWMAAHLRETIVGHPLDVWALMLRLLALALTVRALILGRHLIKRLLGWVNPSRYGLALAPEGLVLRTPRGDTAISREDIVDIRECSRQSDRSGRRWLEVFLVINPETGRTWVPIDPFLDAKSSVLAARLTRWRGPVTASDAESFPDPDRHAGTLFKEVDAGSRLQGITVVPLGRAWLKRGPYASVLLGLAVLDGFIRFKPMARATTAPTVPLAIAICLIAVPVVWLVVVHRQLGPLTRAALLMTPAGILIRIRSGIDQIRWPQLFRVDIDSKRVWSMFEGMYESRSIVYYGEDGFTVSINEAYLGMPADVVVAVAQAYLSRVLPISTQLHNVTHE